MMKLNIFMQVNNSNMRQRALWILLLRNHYICRTLHLCMIYSIIYIEIFIKQYVHLNWYSSVYVLLNQLDVILFNLKKSFWFNKWLLLNKLSTRFTITSSLLALLRSSCIALHSLLALLLLIQSLLQWNWMVLLVLLRSFHIWCSTRFILRSVMFSSVYGQACIEVPRP